jgi:hypothetical protein
VLWSGQSSPIASQLSAARSLTPTHPPHASFVSSLCLRWCLCCNDNNSHSNMCRPSQWNAACHAGDNMFAFGTESIVATANFTAYEQRLTDVCVFVAVRASLSYSLAH